MHVIECERRMQNDIGRHVMIPCTMSSRTNSEALEQSGAWHRPCPWNLRHWRWWCRFSNSLVETWDAFFCLLTQKKPIAHKKGCFSQRFWGLKIGFLVSIVAAFSKSNVAIWIWVIPATSGASQMPFDPPVPRDWTNRITCNCWLFLPGQPGPQISWTNH